MLNNWDCIKQGIDRYGREMEIKKISDNLTITFYDTDSNKVFIKVDYMNGKFTIERGFNKTLEGRDRQEEFLDLVDSEEKVKQYLNL